MFTLLLVVVVVCFTLFQVISVWEEAYSTACVETGTGNCYFSQCFLAFVSREVKMWEVTTPDHTLR